MGDRWCTGARSSSRQVAGSQPAGLATAQSVPPVVAAPVGGGGLQPEEWGHQGIALVPLTALYLISAMAPLSVTHLAQALGAELPAASALVDRLIDARLVWPTADPRPGPLRLALTPDGQMIIEDAGPDTAYRLLVVLRGRAPGTCSTR